MLDAGSSNAPDADVRGSLRIRCSGESRSSILSAPSTSSGRIRHSIVSCMGWLARRKIEQTATRTTRVAPLRSAPVEVQIMGRGSLDVLHARNVSATGLGIYVPHGFAGIDLSQEVELVVTLPGVRSFLARGVIRHVTDAHGDARHFGVELTSIADKDREAILGYVRSRLA